MPENPKALSPTTASTRLPVSIAAAIAKPVPMPMTPHGTDVETLARLVDVDDAARQIEGVGAFVDEDRIRPLLDDGTQRTKRGVEIHRHRVVSQPRRHLGDVFFLLALTVLIHSSGGFGQSLPMPSSSRETHDSISPTIGAAISTLLSISLGSMSI